MIPQDKTVALFHPAETSSAALARPKAQPRALLYEVHPRVARLLIGFAPSFDVDEQDLIATLGMTPYELELHLDHMTWNTFAALLNLYEARSSRPEVIARILPAFAGHPLNTTLRKVLRNVASPGNLYTLMHRYIGPRMMPCLSGRAYERAGGILVNEIELILPHEATPCPIYFQMMSESLRMAPQILMGLDPAVVIGLHTDGLKGSYEMRLPPSRSLLRRIRDALRIFWGARSLFDLLEEHQTEQGQVFSQLNRLNQELEQRVAERTQELALLNDELALARDQAQRENDAKSRYLANMSHEIRTPLSAIIGYAELLQEEVVDQVDEHSAEDLRNITLSAKHLLALIGDILDLSKLEADKLHIYPSPLNLSQLLHEVVNAIKPLASQHSNLLRLNELAPSQLVLETDPIRLKQILTNLLSNAAKFTHNGKIFVTSEIDTRHDIVLIHVKDTGLGMNAEELARIFNPFEQARRETQRDFGGTGLGMTISRQLAELLGGSLTATSTPGQGSTFTLMLPLHACSLP